MTKTIYFPPGWVGQVSVIKETAATTKIKTASLKQNETKQKEQAYKHLQS